MSGILFKESDKVENILVTQENAILFIWLAVVRRKFFDFRITYSLIIAERDLPRVVLVIAFG